MRSGRVRESQDGSGKKRGESTQLKEISRKEACPQILLTWKETGEEARKLTRNAHFRTSSDSCECDFI